MNMKKTQDMIMPVGPLMKEHRLIERLIALLEKEIQSLQSGKAVDIPFIKGTADFIKAYADECHHGKEEDILFRELAKKELSVKHRQIMDELIIEHKYGRKTLKELIAAEEKYEKGEKSAKSEVLGRLKALAAFYPTHIEKEDKHFFLPCMDYFSRKEKDEVLEEFREFDQDLIHKKYKQIVEQMEKIKNV